MSEITARPTGGSAKCASSWLESEGLTNHVASHQDVIFERKEHKAFCLNCGSKREGKLYLIGSRTFGRVVDKPRDGWQCPHCDYAVTWRSSFRRPTKEELGFVPKRRR